MVTACVKDQFRPLALPVPALAGVLQPNGRSQETIKVTDVLGPCAFVSTARRFAIATTLARTGMALKKPPEKPPLLERTSAPHDMRPVFILQLRSRRAVRDDLGPT